MAHKVLSCVALRDWIQQKKKKKKLIGTSSRWALWGFWTVVFFRISPSRVFQQPITSNQLANQMCFLTQPFVFTPMWDWRHKEEARLRPLQAVLFVKAWLGIEPGTSHVGHCHTPLILDQVGWLFSGYSSHMFPFTQRKISCSETRTVWRPPKRICCSKWVVWKWFIVTLMPWVSQWTISTQSHHPVAITHCVLKPVIIPGWI